MSFIKSINIGNKTLVSDFRLPGNKEIIFLNGTSFGANLTMIRRGILFFLENKKVKIKVKPKKRDLDSDEEEEKEVIGIRFKKLLEAKLK